MRRTGRNGRGCSVYLTDAAAEALSEQTVEGESISGAICRIIETHNLMPLKVQDEAALRYQQHLRERSRRRLREQGL